MKKKKKGPKKYTIPIGGILKLAPGKSITIKLDAGKMHIMGCVGTLVKGLSVKKKKKR
jgi:hypothetical protein